VRFDTISPKQAEIFTFIVEPYETLICDGAVRSGKTIMMSIAFIEWAMATFSGCSFGICGKTVRSVERNVVMPVIQTRSIVKRYGITYNRSLSLMTVRSRSGTNFFYLFGGKDESSYMLIQGITLSGVIFDEVALMPQSFVQQAIARTLSVDDAKLWFNCNPEGPDHWFYKEWVLKSSEHNAKHLHFLMSDNPGNSAKALAKAETDFSGVFYKRYVQGIWVTAEGVIFPVFADDPQRFTIADAEADKLICTKKIIGIDFGGNSSKTTMVLTGYQKYDTLTVLAEDGLPITQTIDAAAICDRFVAFYRDCIKRYRHIDFVLCDSASPTMINSLVSAAKAEGLPWRNIAGCRKNEVSQRPRTVDRLLMTGRLKIAERCTEVRRAISNLRWDEKKPDIPEDKNIGNINDWWDAFCYTWLDFVEFIDRR